MQLYDFLSFYAFLGVFLRTSFLQQRNLQLVLRLIVVRINESDVDLLAALQQ